MIKDNQRHFNRLHIVLDAVVVVLSYLLAWVCRFLWMEGVQSLSFSTYCMVLIPLIPYTLFVYFACNLYTPKRVQGRRLEIGNIVQANAIVVLTILVCLQIFNKQIPNLATNFSRTMLFLFFFINVSLEALMRNGIRYVLRKMRKSGFNLKHILLVGYSRAAEEYIDRIIANPQWGYYVCGILDDNVARGTEYRGIQVIGSCDDISYILPANELDEIAITLGLHEYSKLEHIVAQCEKSGVHTKFIPDYNNIIPTKPYTEDLMGLPVINIRYVPLSNTFNALTKRVVDIFGATVAILLFSPIMLITALLIKITSKGPLIYAQERVGLHNKTFKMYKFRSMEVQAPSQEKKAWTVKDDPRVTAVGKIIRRTSVDELPQLFNILKGDMSLVGPRPERPFFVEKFREEIPRYMVKHQVRPGLTGWAQVNGYRGDTSIKKRIEYDLYYIENWTMSLDFKIIFLTFFKGFINKNAY
ncbi:MAG: undecaprenyl-phosphate glucose phosphotransferase [Lachnospiraceae bacterium]